MVLEWQNGLSEEQIEAAQHIDTHARLLAGPGTGKTLTMTRRVLALILDHNVSPEEILALTFTRLAAFQLRNEIKAVLEPRGVSLPDVSTLHSFALRQLLQNANRVAPLPKPIRIADDWEERHIIVEDIAQRHGELNVSQVQDLFEQLSADWQTLDREDPDWEAQFPDPQFIGVWQEHRSLFGYTLRSELVYQLKRALNQVPDFQMENTYQHILVDEYQDLNACDLAVIRELASRDAEIYAAGDDDQSIYGFRYAAPAGIRRFMDEYQPSADLTLSTCYRCDKSILKVSEFVADLDPDRLPKDIQPRENADKGEVRLLHFGGQRQEARCVARMCQYFIRQKDVDPDQILILLRSDRNGALSSVLIEELDQLEGVEVAKAAITDPIDSTQGRSILALLRLVADSTDDLAWRTLLQLTRGIGSGCLGAISDYARSNDFRFARAIQGIAVEPGIIPRLGKRIAQSVVEWQAKIQQLTSEDLSLSDTIERATLLVTEQEDKQAELSTYFYELAEESNAQTPGELVEAIGTSLEQGEQELVEGAVNILTMHKAKGLSADVVVIAGAEDEFIPGRNTGAQEGDERRLLYVSMTRARHHLYLTYCQRRTGQQKHLGSNPGRARRLLTRFLHDAPVSAEAGQQYVLSLIQER